MRPALAAFLIFGLVVLHAGDTDDERKTLRGVTGFRIVIESLDPDAVEDGLTKAQIQTDVELHLRKAGVPINGDSRIFLHVSLLFERDESQYFVYTRVEVNQPVTPLVSKELTWATTWSVQSFGSVGRGVMARSMREVVGDKVDMFANAYLSANPKR